MSLGLGNGNAEQLKESCVACEFMTSVLQVLLLKSLAIAGLLKSDFSLSGAPLMAF